MVALIEHVERGAFHALVILLLVTIGAASGQKTEINQVLPNDNDDDIRTFRCRSTDNTGQQTRLSGAVFYLNEIDVRTNLTNGEYSVGDGEIMFTMRQELEGEYTCYEGGSCPGVCETLVVVARPSANNSIPLYYLKKVGESVTMICGTQQGLLASRYTAEWLIDQTINVEFNDSYRGRVDVIREELKDYSLTISPLTLTGSIEYQCRVKIEIVEGDPHYVRNPAITLQVYEEPIIQFLTSETVYIAHQNQAIEHSVLSFSCNATGSPNLMIVWRRNGYLIPSDSESFVVNPVATGSSMLQVKEPKLSDSGNITCEATIQYFRVTDDGKKGEITEASRRLFRRLIILDSSLEPRPFATQDADLLLRMDIPDQATIPETTKIRLRIIPRNSYNTTEISGIPVDDVFFEGTRFYAFVPASQLFGHRQFHVQVALELDGKIGPYSPETTSELQYIDIDEIIPCDNYELVKIIGVVLGSVAVALIVVVAVSVTCCIWMMLKSREKIDEIDADIQMGEQNVQQTYMIYNTQQCQNVTEMLKLANEILDKEQRSPNSNKVMVGQLNKSIPSLIETFELLARRIPERGGIADDGGGLEDFTGGEDDQVATDEDKAVKEVITKLMQDIQKALSAPCE